MGIAIATLGVGLWALYFCVCILYKLFVIFSLACCFILHCLDVSCYYYIWYKPHHFLIF